MPVKALNASLPTLDRSVGGKAFPQPQVRREEKISLFL